MAMGVPSGAAYTGPREVHYLFVDGGALRGRLDNLSKRFFGEARLAINFQTLAGNYAKVFYYDAVPVREREESESNYDQRIKPIRDILDSAANVDRLHVYEGDARRRRRRGLEQKKVDVMLTVDMLTHTFRKNMHQATLLTGDNDFKPLIDALVQDWMFVTLMYPPEETSKELLQAADARVPMTMQVLYGYLTDAAKPFFVLPKMQNYNPATAVGSPIANWSEGGRECGLYKQGQEYVVTQVRDASNRLHVTHSNEELLKYFCKESFNIHVPD
jgi:uncharacterized LabA/DUF88 family protein